MGSSKRNPFAGLPVALVHDMMEKSGEIADTLYGTIGDISKNRDDLRRQLLENGIVQNNPPAAETDIPSSCGIGWRSSVDKLPGACLSWCAAFAVEGLIPPSGARHWDAPLYQTMFHAEKEQPGTADLVKAVGMEMAVELAAGAPQAVVFFNGSFMTALVSVMETLKTALELKESPAGREYLTRLKSSIAAFQTIVTVQNGDRVRAGVAGDSSGREVCARLQLPDHYNDTLLCTLLLSPGEYTAPLEADTAILSRIADLPIRDEKFAAVRDGLVKAMSGLRVVYYRPFAWTPALRFEVQQSVAGDSAQMARLLCGVRFQSSNPGIHEPYPLYRAESMAKSIRDAMPSFRSSVVARMTCEHSDDIGDLFSLILDKKYIDGRL